LRELEFFRGDEVLAGQGVGNELADGRRERGDVADGARARPLGGAEGLADEPGVVNLGAAAGFGNLDENLLPIKGLLVE
jgi:hypothetical protein